nr:M56 family metallopeptidase [uncultured Sediminibacterium sp.]
MQSLFQSAFLQALGYSIANSLWQMAFLWLLYLLISSVLKPSAAHKYLLAVCLQFMGFIWFVFTLQFYHNQYSRLLLVEGSGLDSKTIATLVPQGQGIRSQVIEWMLRGEQLLPYLSVAYLLLMVVLCTRWFIGYRYTLQIKQQGLSKIPVDWRLFVKNTAQQLGIKREISIFLSEKISTPLTVGFLKPLILVPIASINHLTVSQLEAVILHEMAHIKRYDYLVNIILSLAEISLFFNPFTQLMSKQIRKERENSCDDWVLQFQYSASTYAEALLRIAQLQATPVFAMAAKGSNENELLTRVKRMIGGRDQVFNYHRQLLAFLLVTGILSSIAWLNPEHAPKQANISQVNDSLQQQNNAVDIQPVTVEPMAVKVTNPLFNPAFFLSKTLKAEMQDNLQKAKEEIRASLNSKEVQQAIQDIPVVLNDAYTTLNTELFKDKNEWKKELAELEKAKAEMKTAIQSIDTLSIPLAERKQAKEEMKLSLKKMELDFEEAKDAMSKLKTAIPFKQGQEEMKKGIEKAITEIQKLKLDKNFSQIIELSGLLNIIDGLDIKIDAAEETENSIEKKKEKKQVEKKKIKVEEQKEIVEEEITAAPLIPVNHLEIDTETLYNQWLADQVKKLLIRKLELEQLNQTDSSFNKQLEKFRELLLQQKKKARI